MRTIAAATFKAIPGSAYVGCASWSLPKASATRFPSEGSHLKRYDARLVGVSSQLDRFCSEVAALGRKLGCVLVQVPPSLAFERSVASRFLAMLRRRHDGTVAVEPRHPSWFSATADAVLIEFGASRLAAGTSVVPAAADPGGDTRTSYLRLHGSPKIYYSTYTDDSLAHLGKRARAWQAKGAEVWCIFDNTALGAATVNALDLSRRLGDER